MNHTITHQHTFLFPETGECVTAYISDTESGFFYGMALNHKGFNIKWESCPEAILQINSEVNDNIWYVYFNAYWASGGYGMPVEEVLLVKTCKASHHIKERSDVPEREQKGNKGNKGNNRKHKHPHDISPLND
jgi:hypothetical protein